MNVTAVLAWRNLWRHKRRTWLTIGAMVFCNTLLVFLISLQLGSYQMMIENTIGAFTGHLQIQHSQFHDEQKMRQSVPHVVQLAQQVRDNLGVETVAARGVAFALASSEQRSFGIQVTGVQPQYEKAVSTFPGLIREGRYLEDPGGEEIIIGAVLARNLKVGVGDELTFLGSGLDGSFAAGVATIVGIVDTGFADVDRAVAQVPLAWFQSVFSMGDSGHSVAVKLGNLDAVDSSVLQVRDMLGQGEQRAGSQLSVLDWNTLEPGLRQAIKSDMTSAWFMYGVLILLVAFSVLNTQLMSVLERTREFGVMLALGTRPAKLAKLVSLETFVMSCIGMGLGILLGGVISVYLSYAGFYYPGMEEMAAKFNLPDRMYPQISALSLLWGPATVFVGAMLASIYPATRLFTLHPVAAMRAV
ncbi:MAG: ABC-type lipoprotein release transport system permease subunit [Halioglobus sp.]